MKILTIQPGEAVSKDVCFVASSPTTNGDVAGFGYIEVGARNATGTILRTAIQFDLTALPANAIIHSATLSLYCTVDLSGNARTFRVFRLKRVWVETEITWNIYSTGNNWQTAGGFGVNDCEQTEIGSRNFTAAEAVNEFKNFILAATAKTDLDWGLEQGGSQTGFLIKADVENTDSYRFADASAVVANRPKLVITYTLPSGNQGQWTHLCPFGY